MCIIDDGHIIADDTPASLRAKHSRSVLTVTTGDPDGLTALARTAGADPAREGDAVIIGVPGADVARRLLAAHGDGVRDFEFRHGRMDDVFLALTGRSAAGAGRIMSVVLAIVGRNLRIFFRDALNVFFSLLGAVILFGLYTLFLGNLQTTDLTDALPGATTAGVQAYVDSWMFAGIVLITTVTTGLGALGGAGGRRPVRTIP